MDDPNLTTPPEAPRDPIEIRDEDAITIDEALIIATENDYPLGKSTLQRWAKFWEEHRGPVRSILVTHAAGKFYKFSREDFKSWVFDRKQNARPPEAPHEVGGDATRIKELESEVMNLKIDVGVRKQLLERAKEEMDEFRSMTNNLLRENGAPDYQLRQLAAPKPSRQEERPQQPVASPQDDNRQEPPLVDTYPHHTGDAAQ